MAAQRRKVLDAWGRRDNGSTGQVSKPIRDGHGLGTWGKAEAAYGVPAKLGVQMGRVAGIAGHAMICFQKARV